MTWVELLAQSAWRGSIILAAAFAAVAGLRRASAAVRHFVWTAALAAIVALPVALLVVPKWSWRAATAERAETVVVVSRHVEAIAERAGGGAPPVPRATKTDWLVALWVLGCAAVATRFLLGAGRASWMAPRAAEARHAGAMLEELRRDGPGARAGRHAGYRAPVAVPAYAAERTAGGGGDHDYGGFPVGAVKGATREPDVRLPPRTPLWLPPRA